MNVSKYDRPTALLVGFREVGTVCLHPFPFLKTCKKGYDDTPLSQILRITKPFVPFSTV